MGQQWKVGGGGGGGWNRWVVEEIVVTYTIDAIIID